jgi:transcriptional regulator with XRE-family HTH domain
MNLEKLKELRLKNGMTQIDVAKAVGVTMNAYIRWEQGANQPTEENLQKLKEVLGVKE